MHFTTMAEWLEGAKVQFACSANYLDHIDVINLSPEQQTFLKEIPDAMFRETTRDFMVNQQFRKDYWVKGARKLNPLDQADAMRAQKVMLTSPRGNVSLQLQGAVGEVSLSEGVYNPILDALASHQAMTLGELEQATQKQGVSLAQIMQAAMVLTGAGHLTLVQPDAVVHEAKPKTDKINAHIMQLSRGSNEVSYLASPVTGGGVTVNRFQQLFLLAMRQGLKEPAQWAAFVWDLLQSQSQKLVKGGETIDSAEDNLAELKTQADEFQAKELPVLKALLIA